jgi:hypothetical protein
MRNICRCVLVTLVISMLWSIDALASDLVNAQSAEIGDVVMQVKDALANVQTRLSDNDLPPLKEVKLSLQTVVAKKVGSTFKFLIITIGGTWEKDKSQQINLTLTPPKPGNAKNVSSVTVTQALEDAIVSAATGVKDAGKGPVPLTLTSLDVQLGFTVKSDANGDGKPVVSIIPVSLDFSGDLSKTAVQQLTVTFGTGGNSGQKNGN